MPKLMLLQIILLFHLDQPISGFSTSGAEKYLQMSRKERKLIENVKKIAVYCVAVAVPVVKKTITLIL